jgi:DNA-binding response OmpR family regulator
MRILAAIQDASVLDAVRGAGHDVIMCTLQQARERALPADIVLVNDADAAKGLARSHPHVAVIVVTKVGDTLGRIRALEVGAADAFDASFAPAQMAVRVMAAGHRAAMAPHPPSVVAADGCSIDFDRCTATRDGETQKLTAREVDILRWLVRHAGRVVPRTELLEHVFGVSPDNATRAVDVAISTLRAKLERDPQAPAIIVSVKGAGYVWGE